MSNGTRVVYDCTLFLQAAARPQRVHSTLRLVRERPISLCLSPAIVAEIKDVLTREELRAKFPALTPQAVNAFLYEILLHAELLPDVPCGLVLPRDPKDQPYLDLAVSAGASHLVTWNDRHLTYLMRRDTAEGSEFCRRFPGLQIVTPPDLIKSVGQQL